MIKDIIDKFIFLFSHLYCTCKIDNQNEMSFIFFLLNRQIKCDRESNN